MDSANFLNALEYTRKPRTEKKKKNPVRAKPVRSDANIDDLLGIDKPAASPDFEFGTLTKAISKRSPQTKESKRACMAKKRQEVKQILVTAALTGDGFETEEQHQEAMTKAFVNNKNLKDLKAQIVEQPGDEAE